MKPSSLIQGIVVALGLSITAKPMLVVFSALTPSVDNQLLIASLTAAYLLYILSRRTGKVGHITLVVFSWGLLFGACFLGMSVGFIILLGVGLIWLLRSVLRYSSLLSALSDGLLCTVSFGCAAAIAVLTGSLALTVWGFFLCQALWVFIPPRFNLQTKRRCLLGAEDSDRFSRSHHAAESALRSIANLGS